MTQQFTASEVRGNASFRRKAEPELAEMLYAYADLLEAQEKAMPVAVVKDSDALYTGWLSWTGEPAPPETKLYTHPAHSAQAQPPAASVTEVTGLTWEPPNVTVDVERVGRFRSGDEHIVRVTFRSSDDGRRMTCFYAANESAVGYLHAMLAASPQPQPAQDAKDADTTDQTAIVDSAGNIKYVHVEIFNAMKARAEEAEAMFFKATQDAKAKESGT